MSKREEVLSTMEKFLPTLTKEEKNFISNLPNEFHIDVPYFTQEKKFWSGAAVVQMLRKFHDDLVPSQEVIAHDAGWNDWREFDHESLSEDLVRYLARHNYMVGVYYPGHYILPNFPTGVKGADYIASNSVIFNEVDHSYFKALLVDSKSPVYIRVHFTTDMYSMPEEMAERLDTSGHALLIVGYNQDGFIVNDPWDNNSWGGTRGGKDKVITYKELQRDPAVNCCLDMVGHFSKLKVHFEPKNSSIYEDREITLSLSVAVSGITGILSDIYKLEDVTAEIAVGGSLRLASDCVQNLSPNIMIAGTKATLSWTINTGSNNGSYPVKAKVLGSLNIPAYEWELNAKNEILTISGQAKTRVDVKSKNWLNKYGRF